MQAGAIRREAVKSTKKRTQLEVLMVVSSEGFKVPMEEEPLPLNVAEDSHIRRIAASSRFPVSQGQPTPGRHGHLFQAVFGDGPKSGKIKDQIGAFQVFCVPTATQKRIDRIDP
jgi:hypothetical protein